MMHAIATILDENDDGQVVVHVVFIYDEEDDANDGMIRWDLSSRMMLKLMVVDGYC